MSFQQQAYTIGTDAEVFGTKDGEVVSLVGLVGGTKEKPRPVNSGALQEDNVMAEINITPVSINNPPLFRERIEIVLAQLAKHLRAKGMGYKVLASAKLSEKELSNPQAMAIGCDPDFDVYDDCNPRQLKSLVKTNLRTSGGHIHIGFGNDGKGFDHIPLLIKLCDIGLGLQSVIEDRDNVRRKYYGGAGAFRYKPYGVEYRTLSNYWIEKDSEIIAEKVGDILDTWYYFREELRLKSIIARYEFSVKACIGSGDIVMAERLIKSIRRSFYENEVSQKFL